ncbi:NAD(P)-binding domain-containing protein [Kribbella sp. NPDC051952]|uniref:NADPH-dependent F420 reductase n=1 Tax=Kribbella sp. NPDC051952 TaxID=3154851 RepID=UPI00341CB972
MTTVGVLGTGQVGLTLAGRLAALGYTVTVGARTSDSASLHPAAELPGVRTGSFADAARAADLIINATNGMHSQAALGLAGEEALADKTILDVSNALEPVEGGFPRPIATTDDSVGQRLQAAFPRSRVVKSLCTMNCKVMADPSLVPGDHVVFLSGDDQTAKSEVQDLLAAMGWRPVQMIDLGGIDTAAGQELLMSIWMRVTIARGPDAPRFNWAINAPDRP